MPCDAIATARAKISNEAIIGLITPEVVKKVIRNLLEKKGEPVIGEREWGNVIQIDTARYTVAYNLATHTVTVQGGSPKLADEIAQRIDQVGGLLLQQKLANDIKARYPVLKSERRGQALQLTLEL
jgi:hypothetical protein